MLSHEGPHEFSRIAEMADPKPPRLGLLTAVLTALWAGSVAAGFLLLHGYEAAPGPTGDPPACWPAASRIKPTGIRPTLLLFAQPRCPCTRTTIAELDLIMAHCQEKVDAYVLFYKPSGSTPAWEQTGTWRAARRIPGVRVAVDVDGAEAARFSAKTSGQALLYGRDGKLVFRGGITGSRGHAGDNLGRNAIVAFVTDGIPEVKETLVFGCPLSANNADVR